MFPFALLLLLLVVGATAAVIGNPPPLVPFDPLDPLDLLDPLVTSVPTPTITPTAALPTGGSVGREKRQQLPFACETQSQACFRANQPYFTSVHDPYHYPDSFPTSNEEASMVQVCRAAFVHDFSAYLSTAPITPGSPKAAAVVSVTSGIESTWIWSVPTSFSLVTTTWTNTATVNANGPGDSTQLDTFVNNVGVQVSTSHTVKFETKTLSETFSEVIAWDVQKTTSIAHVDITTRPAYTPYSYQSIFTYKPSAPCCSSCTLYGSDVQVFYWPATRANGSAPATTLVNEVGFTLYDSPPILPPNFKFT